MKSKDLTSLSLDELIGNLKVYELIIKKDFEIVKGKGERKSLTLKAKKEPSDEESLTSKSEDEEYAMAVRDFKKFFNGRGRCGDSNHLIRECSKPPRDKNQRAFVGGSWSDSGEEDDENAKDETCLMAQASSEVHSESSYFSDENSSIDDFTLDSKGTISHDSLNIANVEHVNNLGFNLLSVSQICDNKSEVIFFEHDSEITKDEKVIGRGIQKIVLYVIKLRKKLKDKICLTTIDENSTLWHRRLGHANVHLIQSLASKELVMNLPKLKFGQHFCDACKIGKQTHISHKAKNMVSTTIRTPSHGSFRSIHRTELRRNLYTLVIVDDYSRRQPRMILPYGMLLTRLFNHVMSNFPELSNDLYVLCDCVMYPLAPQHERKIRKDYGTKRGRHSTSASSSSAFDHPSSSHHVDDDNDEDDKVATVYRQEFPARNCRIPKNLLDRVSQLR
ncbi:retrovirus-related pol polyprotein from transposon TNT 1-94 [Tanacetum coccineum]